MTAIIASQKGMRTNRCVHVIFFCLNFIFISSQLDGEPSTQLLSRVIPDAPELPAVVNPKNVSGLLPPPAHRSVSSTITQAEIADDSFINQWQNSYTEYEFLQEEDDDGYHSSGNVEIGDISEQNGAVGPMNEEENTDPGVSQCSVCKKLCKDYRGMRIHQSFAHKIKKQKYRK